MRKPQDVLPLFAVIALCLSSCAHERYYAWHYYPTYVEAHLREQKGADPEEQVEALELQRMAMETSNERVPPGFYGHLGYMQHLAGNDRLAIRYLRREARLYPESEALMKRLIKNLGGGEAATKTGGTKL